MKILVTGTEGYIGARLAPWLHAAGHEVSGLDTGFYRDGCLYLDPLGMPFGPQATYKDLRTVSPADFEGFDAVIHLAELSNDPLGQNRPEITFKINHEGSVHIAKAAREAGVRRFVYASSCSVYGVGTGRFPRRDLAHQPADRLRRVQGPGRTRPSCRWPTTASRSCSCATPPPTARRRACASTSCSTTCARSPAPTRRSRWSATAARGGRSSTSRTSAKRCAAPPRRRQRRSTARSSTSARPRENYRVREIAQIVAEAFPGCEVSAGPPSQDNRSYRVSFDKIATQAARLQGALDGAARAPQELRRLFERIEFSPGHATSSAPSLA